MKIYRISESGDMFCRGYCPEFAIALHRLTGYPIYVFNEIETFEFEDDGNLLEEEDINYLLAHVAVKLPDGRFMDARGIRSEQEIGMNILGSDATPLPNYKLLPYSEDDLYAEQEIVEEVIDMAIDYIKKHKTLFNGIK
ncbi:unnamed protein product [marine sediment metagenome]|uniref:Uncharacterized protein n=1 Tax=marine sediment metagenome TaxID=412755 RepID=X1AR98_9ZZZZ